MKVIIHFALITTLVLEGLRGIHFSKFMREDDQAC